MEALDEPRRVEALGEPSFWYAYFTIGFGQRGPAFDGDVLATALGIDDTDALDWWHRFTGWYDGVIEEADGRVERPGSVDLALDSGDRLVVEAHPGDTYLYLRRQGGPDDTLANFGPHWRIPQWSVAGASSLAGSSAPAFLLLAPLVRLAAGEDSGSAESSFCDAWVRTRLVDPTSALALATEWRRCVSG
jgi:hypothetical protein